MKNKIKIKSITFTPSDPEGKKDIVIKPGVEFKKSGGEDMRRISFTLKGTSPLIQHKWFTGSRIKID